MASYKDIDITNIFSGNLTELSEGDFENEEENDECKHASFTMIKGNKTCNTCGKLLYHVSLEKDWRFYGSNDNRTQTDPARCHKKRSMYASIIDMLKEKNFSEAVCEMAQKWYINIVKSYSEDKPAIFRGRNRLAIAAACVYYARIEEGDCLTWEEVCTIFDIKKKKLTLGINRFITVHPEYSKINIKAQHLVKKLLLKLDRYNETNYNDIVNWCKKVYESSQSINNSKPYSVAAAIIYLYFFASSSPIAKTEYSKKIKLSDGTITSLINEIQPLLVKLDLISNEE